MNKLLITGKTKLLGVIGCPVEHSLSPVMHNAAIAELGLDYVYLPFPIEPQNLGTAIAGFAATGVVGFSVTIPHKQTIIPLLSEISPIARTIGAVNTVTRQNHQWVGTNTDMEGFIAPLQRISHSNWSEQVVVILGHGGAARAVVAGCQQLGCEEIHVLGRSLDKLTAFRHSWASPDKIQIHTWDKLTALIPHAHLLVNTTPVGMYPHIDESPLTLEQSRQIRPDAIAYDLIYTPNPTKFLQQAEKQGAITIDGLEMLVQQGAAALKIWLQQETVPGDVMAQALRRHLADDSLLPMSKANRKSRKKGHN